MSDEEIKKFFNKMEDKIILLATPDYDYKEDWAYFKIGDIEKLVDICRNLLFKIEDLNANKNS
ncbi:hypothetical protein [uncultured Rikenella sp.]|uniref:hypothetical protein n=1 Tax=uncultured Rikenella sp. TaxID=368003 RepID=UPI002622C8F3|nr:hypothetical protein [uncultured Rikenella sp.]